VEIIYILRPYQDLAGGIPSPGKLGRSGRIGLDFKEILTALVVKFMNQVEIPDKGLGCGHVFDAVLLPEPSGPAEGLNPRLCRNYCSGENDDIFGPHGQNLTLSRLDF